MLFSFCGKARASATKGPFIVAAYVPCQACNYACVIVERFDHNPSNDELDRHAFRSTCDNCGQMQVRVGRDAFRRTIVEWNLEIRAPHSDELPPSE
ncbi:MAG: hypothetical protein ABSD63_01115 [Candidatus Korobacteraceae bacterium]